MLYFMVLCTDRNRAGRQSYDQSRTPKHIVCASIVGTYRPFSDAGSESKDSLLMPVCYFPMDYFSGRTEHSMFSFIFAMIALVFAIGVRFNGICAGIPLFIWAGFILVNEYRWRSDTLFSKSV